MIPIFFCFTGGILVGHAGYSPDPSLFIILFFGFSCALILSVFLSSRSRYFFLLYMFFLVGVLLDLNSHREWDLLPLAGRRELVMIEGTVLEPAKVSEEVVRLVLRADLLLYKGSTKPVREKLQINIYNHGRNFSPGEKVLFPARLRPFENFNNSGRYNYELDMDLKGFSCAASVSDGRQIVPMGIGEAGFFRGILEQARRPIRHLFKKNLSPENQALFQALILGETQNISQKMREPFNRAGLGHLLAVSGLHIGLVGWLAYALFMALLSVSYRFALQTNIKKLAAILTCVPVIVYAFLAGFQVSSQRAMIMALAYLFSIVIGREKEIWSTLAAAAFAVLAINPHSLFGISFQLSFCAVIGILWLAPPIYRMMLAPLDGHAKGGSLSFRLYRYLGGLLAVSTSAMIFLFPIVSFYFHRLSLVALPANLMAVPIMGLWVIPLGLLSAAALPVSSALAELLLQLGAWGMDCMTAIIRFWSQVSWASIWVVTPNSFEILIFYSLIFFIFFFRRWSWAKLGLVFVFFLAVGDFSYWTYKTRFNPHLEVTFLDVGQGNSALIRFPGRQRMLIDGGGFSRSTFDMGKNVVAPFLWRSKILRVDYLVMSHPQSDHMNGLHFIASHFHAKEFWSNGDDVENESYKNLIKILDEKGIKKLFPGDLMTGREISGVRIDVLHPRPNQNKSKLSKDSGETNNRSLVLRMSYGGKSVLFPGDVEQAAEETLVSSVGCFLKSDVLLSPHHGSKSSSSELFLQAVKPSLCIISCGRGNYFGFPHSETLRRLEEVGCEITRIDQLGSVRLSIAPGYFEKISFLKED
ncbi:MAG: DNA internalization-related competence protein ComEC/Rec2 [Deltaproteobacteria bacterium]|nr:DNA internalization-related competence protein ComEC/Rec2 [Deltaproteobacteria bacterium]